MTHKNAPKEIDWRERPINHDPFFFQIATSLLLIGVGILVGAALFRHDTGYGTNLYTEILSIIVTISVLNTLAQRREKRRELEQLIRFMRSRDNGTALMAVEELRANGWLVDGTLTSAHLRRANLRQADLQKANLENTFLLGANLNEVTMHHVNLHRAILAGVEMKAAWVNVANLSQAHLNEAELQGSYFRGTNFENAYMDGADFEGADLSGANLRGASLMDANLQDVKLTGAQFDEETIMPDHYNWTPETDLERFTDEYHPEFWRPQDFSWLTFDDDSAPPWWLRGQERPRRD